MVISPVAVYLTIFSSPEMDKMEKLSGEQKVEQNQLCS